MTLIARHGNRRRDPWTTTQCSEYRSFTGGITCQHCFISTRDADYRTVIKHRAPGLAALFSILLFLTAQYSIFWFC